jgi:CheY-like chemotaxis protein
MKKALILIAEDDRDDRFLLQNAFVESGNFELLKFVENGVEVMSYLNDLVSENGENYPDLIILDLNMPKKNGKEVLGELRNHPVFKKIPVIIYTTTSSEIEMEKCFELGASTYIVKPASFELLLEVVEQIRTTWLSPSASVR